MLWTCDTQTSNEPSSQQGDPGTVWWIVSKVVSESETVIQVVIADHVGGWRAKIVAYDIKQLLQNGINAASGLLFCRYKQMHAVSAAVLYESLFIYWVS